MKLKEGAEATGDDDLGYDGHITNAAIDGSIDYHNRPADKSKTGRWPAVIYIMCFVVIERLAFYGIALNLISYLTTVLNEGTAESITSVWNWGGVAWITPLLGGFIADAYLGRFKTILIGLFIYLAGMVLLTLTVAFPALKPPPCPATSSTCPKATPLSLGLFYLALYIIAAAIGAIKPCASSLGADQFDEEDPQERPLKRSFFNYWWISTTGGAVIALTFLVYIEDHIGFGWGYGIPTVGMVFAIVSFLTGRKRYRYKRALGSPMTQVAKVVVSAVRKWRVRVPGDAGVLYEGAARPEKRNVLHSNNFSFLDKAATITPDDERKGQSAMNSWRLCTVTQVEEVKLLVKVMPIWLSTLMFIVTAQQLSTVYLRQGLTMDLHMGPHFKIPPASLELSSSVTAMLAIPLYDMYLVPFVRKFTGNERGFSLLQRIGIGLVMSVLGMAVSAIVEAKRLGVVDEYGMQTSREPLPISVFWLTPQYAIMGIAQVFAWMGMLEFFYDQAPDDMQSIGTALFLSNTGVAHFLCTAIVNLVGQVTSRDGKNHQWIQPNTNQSRLDKYYWLLTAMAAVNCLFFFAAASWYTYKQAERRVVRSDHKASTKIAPSENPEDAGTRLK